MSKTAPPAEKDAAGSLKIFDCEDEADRDIQVLWGGVLLTTGQLNLDFYLAVNSKKNKILEFAYGIFEKPPGVQFVDKPQEHVLNRERIEKNYPSDQTFKYGELFANIGDDIEEFILEKKNIQKLTAALAGGEEKQLEKLIASMPHIAGLEEGPATVRGVALSPQLYGGGSSPSKSSKKREPTRDKMLTDGEEEVEKVRGVETLPRVAICTTVVNGVSAKDLKPRDVVKFRVVGKMVKNLPEDKIDERREKTSLPLPGWVIEVRESPALPEDIEGKSESYRLVVLRAEAGFAARGYLLESERVLIPDENKEKPSNPALLPQSARYIIYPLAVILPLIFLLFMIG